MSSVTVLVVGALTVALLTGAGYGYLRWRRHAAEPKPKPSESLPPSRWSRSASYSASTMLFTRLKDARKTSEAKRGGASGEDPLR